MVQLGATAGQTDRGRNQCQYIPAQTGPVVIGVHDFRIALKKECDG
jgi:hypothetical protein